MSTAKQKASQLGKGYRRVAVKREACGYKLGDAVVGIHAIRAAWRSIIQDYPEMAPYESSFLVAAQGE